ncbi:hypothetical protein [Blastococcus sp. TF02A-26]|uniref:hypothetical protein n=1 Tax=Blastococcus sp. TF02A-26 TaxID=2250577 RepID=UPI000DE826A2|nr:hypothetical protein [Blastococcus sp. TF02A-26]RBY90549.1 hypothetical protein DQ240_00200 [Blastococcus sp. TF02A-26]
MNTPARVAAFALGLTAVFGASLGVGAAVGPVDAEPAADDHTDGGHADDGPPGTGGAHDDAGHDPAAAGPGVGGLAVSESGHTLDLLTDTLPAGTSTLAFRVLGPDGAPVTAFDVEHEEDLHLVAVRRDLSGYQHVHPELAPDGTWTVPLDLTPGSWRVVADATPTELGEGLVLGADLSVPGDFEPRELPPAAATAEVDGYTVVLTGHLTAGEESELQLSISRDGVPITDLQPYLGAYGHLVVLRAGDLAYLHVHPVDAVPGTAAAPGPHVVFATTPPAAGTHRLFLDFRHGDVVRTAEFTVAVEDPHA